ncbi:MAG: ATP-grasp domain-containing protein [Chlorobiales bacterium]|nr:ATP-grasp domain-containing protein [Chlorobiales bacterium]
MSEIVVVYGAIPDLNPATQDLKSEISILKSVEDIVSALAEVHTVRTIPFTGDIVLFMRKIQEFKPDAVFNLFEGVYGLSKTEMLIPTALDLMDVPYTGAKPKALQLCLTKPVTKEILLQRSVATPKFRVLEPNTPIEIDLQFPMIVKPEHEDASIGISNQSVVKMESELDAMVDAIWQQYRQGALVEEYIDGREFNVAIIGDSEQEGVIANPFAPVVLPISEICFDTLPEGFHHIVTYNAKWNEETAEYKGTVPSCPAKIAPEMEVRLKQIAMRAFEALGCRDYARVDFRVSKEGVPYVIDINPNPDISKDAGLARSAKAHGLDYNQLVQKIASYALNRSGYSKKK